MITAILSNDATPVPVNSVMEGEIHNAGDIDYWVLNTVQGRVYQIDVTSVTLADPFMRLHDSAGDVLAYDTERRLGFSERRMRVYWEAPWSGPLYVAVSDVGSNWGHL